MATLITERGFFWWHHDSSESANSKQNSVPGILTITDLGEIRLKTYGPLKKARSNDWVGSRRYPSDVKIQGELTEKFSHVLLEGIERRDYSSDDSAAIEQEFAIDSCLERSLEFERINVPDAFMSLEVKIDELSEWLGKRSLRPTPNYDFESVTAKHTIAYERWKLEFPISGETRLTFESRTLTPLTIFSSHMWDRIEFSQHFYCSLCSEDTKTRHIFLSFYEDLEEFLSLLLGTYHHLAWPELVDADHNFYTLYYKRSHPPATDFNIWSALCKFSSVEKDLGSLFQQWVFMKATAVPAILIYISSLRYPYIYAEDRFLILAIGMESLHRHWFATLGDSESKKVKVQELLEQFGGSLDDKKWLAQQLAHAHEPSFRRRTKDCLKELPLPIAKKSLDAFVGACTNRRNDLAHEGVARVHNDVTDSMQTSDLASALGHLFHFLILHLIGLRPDVLHEAATKSVYSQQAILPALEAVGIKIEDLPGKPPVAAPTISLAPPDQS